MNVFEIQGTLSLVVMLALLAVKVFAFVSSLLYSAEAYEAAGKLTKPAWVALTGLGVLAALIGGMFLLSLVFTVAAIVYLVDVRPALAEVTTRR